MHDSCKRGFYETMMVLRCLRLIQYFFHFVCTNESRRPTRILVIYCRKSIRFFYEKALARCTGIRFYCHIWSEI